VLPFSCREYPETMGIGKDFHSSPATKRKNGQMELCEIKKLLHNKINVL
jgi:hypothetical protein